MNIEHFNSFRALLKFFQKRKNKCGTSFSYVWVESHLILKDDAQGEPSQNDENVLVNLILKDDIL